MPIAVSIRKTDIMNDYKEVRFNVEPPSEDACDLLAAALAEEGYESFVTAEDAATLTAYVRAEDFNADAVSRAIAESGAGSTFLWARSTQGLSACRGRPPRICRTG